MSMKRIMPLMSSPLNVQSYNPPNRPQGRIITKKIKSFSPVNNFGTTAQFLNVSAVGPSTPREHGIKWLNHVRLFVAAFSLANCPVIDFNLCRNILDRFILVRHDNHDLSSLIVTCHKLSRQALFGEVQLVICHLPERQNNEIAILIFN